jgi:hypothetical protein
MIYNIHEDPGILFRLSLREIGELCLIITKRILLYFKDVILNHYRLEFEQTQIAQHLQFIQWYVDGLSRYGSCITDPKPIVKFHNLVINVVYDEESILGINYKLSMNLTDLINVGPVALIKILKSFLGNIFNVFDGKIHTPPETLMVDVCMRRINILIQALTNMLPDLFPEQRIYFVTPSSTLSIRSIELDIEYPEPPQ